MCLAVAIADADISIIEQTPQFKSKESLCSLRIFMRVMQDEDGAGEEVLPAVCLPKEWYVLIHNSLDRRQRLLLRMRC